MTGVYFVQFEHRLYRGDSGFNLGLFTTFPNAADHVTYLKTQPGFSEARERFSIEFWGLDRVVWKSGFAFPEREHGPDIPLWAKRWRPQAGETAKAYAKRLCDLRFGGLYHMGPTSEYAQPCTAKPSQPYGSSRTSTSSGTPADSSRTKESFWASSLLAKARATRSAH
jgi:hypothetical protein